jgi:ABC-type Zn uptake system ZnuABC Zn-binding protein ZnuA
MLQRKKLQKIIFPLLIITILGCRKPAEKPFRPMIITSIFPVCDLVRQVAGQRMDVHFIIPAGADPHHYELRPSQIRMLNQADGFIGIHAEFDGWIRRYLPGTSWTFVLMDEMNADWKGHESISGRNPHIWLSVREAEHIVQHVLEWLVSTDPASRVEYEYNAARTVSRLDSLDRALKKLMEPIVNKKMIQWHAAWDWFAADYDLIIVGTLQKGHGREITLKDFQSLIQKAKQEKVRVVVTGINQQDPAVNPFVEAIDGILVQLDTLGDPDRLDKNTYSRLMMENARLLAQALEDQ